MLQDTLDPVVGKVLASYERVYAIDEMHRMHQRIGQTALDTRNHCITLSPNLEAQEKILTQKLVK